jgi:hypothetical protein
MNYSCFLEEITRRVKERLPEEYEVTVRPVRKMLESGGINPSESARNNQSQSVEKSQCASLLLPG